MPIPLTCFSLEERFNNLVIPKYRLYKKSNGDLILQISYNGEQWIDIETVKESEK